MTRHGFLTTIGTGAVTLAMADKLPASPDAEAVREEAQSLAKNGYKVPLFRSLIEDQISAITPRDLILR
jgi:hypothetical protein